MAQLIVRNIEESLVKRLKTEAAKHGCSAEAEHRRILRAALQPGGTQAGFKTLLLAIPPVGEDSDFERSPDHGRELEW
jgi:plasmid stability protein